MKKLRIFVASPSDMAAERAIVRNVAFSLKRIADHQGILIDVIDWDTVVPAMGRPEQVILDQLKPNSWDIFIGIIWHRFGTPPGGKDPITHRRYLSGTEEEFNTAFRLWQQYKRPRIMIYWCKRNIPPESLVTTQFERVNNFFNQFDAISGEYPGLYKVFTATKHFEKLFHDNLQELLIEYTEKDKGQNFDGLEPPGRVLMPNDQFYIERDVDQKVRRQIIRSGQTITIRGAGQTGKSSLLIRCLQYAHAKAECVYINLQHLEYRRLVSVNDFLMYIASTIAQQLKLDIKCVDQIWKENLGPQDKLVKVMEEYILPKKDQQIILAIDEADRLLEVPFHNDFFALLRSWHNNRAIDPQWNKLNLAMVIATEPYLLISNPNQSPFNVGVKLTLGDFNQEQVKDLNRRLGDPLKDKDFESFYDLLHGHPYLTRMAFDLLIREQWTIPNLLQDSASDQGPFGNHLINQFGILLGDPNLQKAFSQIIRQNQCNDDKLIWRLFKAGLIIGQGDKYYSRCTLYERFFKEKFQ